jgi:hypothetical protein
MNLSVPLAVPETDLNKVLTTYYRARIDAFPTGIKLHFMEFYEVHSTKCYSFCLQDHMVYPRAKISTLYEDAKKYGWKIHRIHKKASRFAFPTKEEAFNHFIYMKSRQAGHLSRQLDFLQLFLKNVKVPDESTDCLLKRNLELSELQTETEIFMGKRDVYLIPNTEEKINDLYSFGW